MDKFAVIVAGGSGARMGTAVPKQFLLLQGKPVLWHTLHAFLTAFDDLQIILVLPAPHIERGHSIVSDLSAQQRVQITTGGDTRFESVKNGLKHITGESVVFVHDGVRCLVTPELIQHCFETALQKGNAVPATRAIDSIRVEHKDGNQIVDRNKVRMIQTPQTFLSAIILRAFEQDYHSSFTDEASVVEKLGTAIHLVEGETSNIKITHPLDILVAEKILSERNTTGTSSPLPFL